MKKIFISFILSAFLFSVFAQDAAASNSEIDEMLMFHFAQKMLAIKDAEEAANKKMYIDGKKKLRRGIIFTSVGVGLAVVPFFNLIRENDYYDDYYYEDNPRFDADDIFLWVAGGVFAGIGVPFLIVGNRQIQKYKPQVAIAPNGIKLTMNF